MTYTLPRPAPYSTAQSPSPLPPPQPTGGQSPSPLPPPQPTGGQPPPPNPSGPPIDIAYQHSQNPAAGYGAVDWSSSPAPARQPIPRPWQPSPNPEVVTRDPNARDPGGPREPGPTGGQPPEPVTRDPNARDPNAAGGSASAFGGGLGAQHPVDVFHQMVQHPHGQAILQSLGYTPPPQAAALPQQRPTPSVPNPGLPPPR